MKNLISVLMFTSAALVCGQSNSLEIQKFVDSIVSADPIAGITVGILKNNKIIGPFSAGMSDLSKRQIIEPNTRFRIASVTKVFTAVAAMKLVEKGILDLEAPIQQYIPDYPTSKKGTIKIIHLLRHTSGIGHYRKNENRSLVHYTNLREASSVFEDRKLNFKPGTKYDYTSYGYTLLGACMEAASGKSYGDIIFEYILKPAGMENTFLETRTKKPANQAQLYRLENEILVADVENDLSLIYPAGGYVSTVEDLLLFVDAYEDGKLVSKKSKELMIMPPTYKGKILNENGAIGWNIWTHEEHGQVYHRIGGQSGASALLISYPKIGIAVAILSNQPGLSSIWKINDRLLTYALE